MVTVRTERLLLRRWRPDDLAPMAAINADPEVMRFIGDGSVADLARTALEIAGFERLWESHGFGRFAVEVRDRRVLAGFVGMAVPTDVPEIVPCVEIGWRFGRAYWGRGLATEAARAAMGFAFTAAGLDRLVGIHVVGNEASARIMARLGMRFDRETTEIVHRRPVRVYAISGPEYGSTARP
jgi:RimJ/RimL family protein N-acetyltransferase